MNYNNLKMNTKYAFYIHFILVCAFISSFVSCNKNKSIADAYGVFEATEIIVSSEANGKLLHFNVEEGQTYEQGEVVGCIDTVQGYLQLKQLESSIRATEATCPDIPSQINTLESKIQILNKERARIATLVEANAASSKQLDDVDAEIAMTKSQITATQTALKTQIAATIENVEALKFQKLQLQMALEKCKIKTPIKGTILKKYIEENELAYQGKPLFKIADITNMFIRVYVTEDMLSSIKLGQSVDIHIDQTNGTDKVIEGKVLWISAKAEFTPKMIQTKNERVNMVYAVKIGFHNDGSAKIGMPGDVVFK